MRNLITSQEVIDLAFAENSNMRAESISDTSIRIAEIKYIRPAFGAMYPLLADKYADFTNDYVKPALAYFVKCEIVSSIAIDMSNSGVAVANPQYQSAATDKQRQRLYDSEMSKAKTLLDFALEYIATHSEEFPDFSGEAPKKHHRVGGILLGGGTSRNQSASIAGEALKGDIDRLNDHINNLEERIDAEEKCIPITYSSIEQMRQEGKLTAGAWYRITDYVTETDQENTRSAGHAFDILVLALDERTLGEECRAIAHEGDTYFRNANLDAWKVFYTTDNSRRSWGVPTSKKQPESWTSAWGVLDSNATPQGSKGYTTAEVDGKTLYLYRPAVPTAYLEGKAFYREVVSSTITSTDGFVYEADDAPYYDEEMGEYYYPYEIRVKTAEGEHIATFVHDYESTYYDEKDSWEYPIYFSSDYEEVDGVYHLEPSNGIDAWWEGFKGGVIEEKEREYYSGSLGAIYYAFDEVLPQSEAQPTPLIYSSETGHIYRSDEWEDAVVFTRGIDGGKGVIYRLIDEFGNDLPFDFKNIQHKYNEQWYYTFGRNDKSLNGDAYGNEVKVSPTDALPVYIFAGNASNNTISALPEEVCYFGSDCTRNRLDFNSLVRIETSGKFIGNSIRGTIGTLTSSKTIQDCEVLCLGNSLEMVVNADLFMCRIDVQPRNSMPLVINAGRFQWVDIRGAGYITVADANGNGKYLTMSSFNTGMNGSTIYLQEKRTTSLSNRLEGLQVDILNKGNTETRIDTSSIPLNATHKTNIGINSAGEVKIWNNADKA